MDEHFYILWTYQGQKLLTLNVNPCRCPRPNGSAPAATYWTRIHYSHIATWNAHKFNKLGRINHFHIKHNGPFPKLDENGPTTNMSAKLTGKRPNTHYRKCLSFQIVVYIYVDKFAYVIFECICATRFDNLDNVISTRWKLLRLYSIIGSNRSPSRMPKWFLHVSKNSLIFWKHKNCNGRVFI